MATRNDTENPPQHQHSPPSVPERLEMPDRLRAMVGQLAVLENFLQYQIDIMRQMSSDEIQIKGSQLAALMKMLVAQVANIKLTLHDEITTLTLPQAEPYGTLLNAKELKAWLKSLLEEEIAIQVRKRYAKNA